MSAIAAIRLVAEREVRERLRSRAFLVATVLLLVIMGVAIASPGLFGGKTTDYKIGIPGPPPAGLEAVLARQGKPLDVKVRIERIGGEIAARKALRDRKVDALMLSGWRLLFRGKPDAKLVSVVDAGARSLRLPRQLRSIGVTPAQARSLFGPAVHVESLDRSAKDNSGAEQAVAFFAAILMLMSLVWYGQWVLTGVVEEKMSRVVEIVISCLRPRHLMAGKVLGIGVLGLLQLVLIAVMGVAMILLGVADAPASLSWSIALVVPWFVLGFALYSTLYAAAGALCSKQEDAQTVGQPVAFLLLAAYLVGFISVSESANGPVAQAATIFPLTAPIALPTRSAMAGVPLWQHLLALLLTIIAILGVVRLAGRIYELGLLRTGMRPSLRGVWRLATARDD
ncbi:MAG: ABC transporter permease [Gaiellaceae bacterium]